MKKLKDDLKVVTRELKKITNKVEILSARADSLEKKHAEATKKAKVKKPVAKRKIAKKAVSKKPVRRRVTRKRGKK